MFTYISIEEFADGVVKNNKDANRRELIAALRESLAAKKNGARCMPRRLPEARMSLPGRRQPRPGRATSPEKKRHKRKNNPSQ